MRGVSDTHALVRNAAWEGLHTIGAPTLISPALSVIVKIPPLFVTSYTIMFTAISYPSVHFNVTALLEKFIADSKDKDAIAEARKSITQVNIEWCYACQLPFHASHM